MVFERAGKWRFVQVRRHLSLGSWGGFVADCECGAGGHALDLISSVTPPSLISINWFISSLVDCGFWKEQYTVNMAGIQKALDAGAVPGHISNV
jgi:hypothetical protein